MNTQFKDQVHVVAGATGAIGSAVVSELRNRNLKVIAVERSKQAEGIENRKADLLDLNQTRTAFKGATQIYLCVAIPYDSKLWEAQWPVVIKNVIQVTLEEKAKLIFLDNVYMYGPSLKVPFNETHLQEPITKKGKVRKQVADLVIKAINEDHLNATIGRSADFYGPKALSSTFYISFLENILKGKNPQSLAKLNVPHTYSFTLDNGRALVELGLCDSTSGQVYHLPVSRPVTVSEIMSIFNSTLNTHFKATTVPGPILSVLSMMVPVIKEAKEMVYQFNNPYIMDDSKFRSQFPNFKTTSLEDGIEDMVEYFKPNINKQ